MGLDIEQFPSRVLQAQRAQLPPNLNHVSQYKRKSALPMHVVPADRASAYMQTASKLKYKDQTNRIKGYEGKMRNTGFIYHHMESGWGQTGAKQNRPFHIARNTGSTRRKRLIGSQLVCDSEIRYIWTHLWLVNSQ